MVISSKRLTLQNIIPLGLFDEYQFANYQIDPINISVEAINFPNNFRIVIINCFSLVRHEPRDININLTNSQKEQKLFRNVYGRLWDEYFELKSAEYSIFDYAQSIEMQKYYEEADTLICMFDHLKAFHSNQTIIATIQRGRSYLTETQLHEFRISEIEKTANQEQKK